MFNPPQFAETRLPALHELIRAHGFATLVTTGPDGLEANHLPMLVDPAQGPLGTLRGHVSRSNPVWRAAAGEPEVLVVFQGPHGYITPSWYASKADGGRVVPTWNYAVVHAHGRLRAIEDPAWLRALVGALTDTHEGRRAHPWRVTDAPDEYVARQLGGIVGLEIPIARIEGKWKMSQNRRAEDRAGVVQGLRRDGDAASLGIADLVAGVPPDPPASAAPGQAAAP